MSLLKKIFGDPNKKEIAKIQPIIEEINSWEEKLEKLTDQELKNKTQEFKKRLSLGETLDQILPEVFAVTREAAKRTIGLRHYDEQLIGGIILHQGKIAEMKTGEGKTLVASLALYLNALGGKGAHLVTVNDYLSRRDAGWMGPIYDFLGLSTAAIGHETSYLFDKSNQIEGENEQRLRYFRPISRQEAYLADITYGTNNEFGFDYLRDNMVSDISQLVQRDFNFAIVDEVDSILIDEARTPLIISAPKEESGSLYAQFAQIVRTLKEKTDYLVDEKEKAVSLTEEGMKKVEKLLGIDNVYDNKTVKLVHHLHEALKAHTIFKKNKDYVIKDGEIIIVDEFTGRLMYGRRYSEGLHQAIEAKEGVEVKQESETLATISFQNLFRTYPKLAGMTGTALTEAEEFYKIYKLEVLDIPTHRPVIRIDQDDLIFKTEQGKIEAIVNEVKSCQQKGQPVLVGTISIAKNELLSQQFKRNGIKHQILNAKHHDKEAKIIAQAGKIGSVTLATNMAGRGVDIILGGTLPQKKEEIKEWEKEHQKILQLGGLKVIGTERHEARRIDNQLRGRSGRQGDPGGTIFYVSMDDDLMRIFGGEKVKSLMEKLGLPEDQPIHHKMISGAIESAQKRVEGQNFDIRKHLVDYDDVMNKQREVIYKKREKILQLDPLKDHWLHLEIISLLNDGEKNKLAQKEKDFGPETIRQIEKMLYLRTIDTLWIEHLNTMTELREGIGLRGYGQHDPLVEYKEESYHLFQKLLGEIENQLIEILLKIEIRTNAKPNLSITNQRKLNLQGAQESSAGENLKVSSPANLSQNDLGNPNGVSVTVRQASSSTNSTAAYSGPKVGRNAPCPCGSGKKFKKCHGK